MPAAVALLLYCAPLIPGRLSGANFHPVRIMREGAKRRLAGAVVIVALAVVFVPMLFEKESLDPLPPIQESIPVAPVFEESRKAEVFIEPPDSGVGALGDGSPVDSELLDLPVGDEQGSAPVAETEPTPDVPASAESVTRSSTAKPTPPPVTPQAPPPMAPSDGMPSWVVQVASLGTPESAAALEGKLRGSGFSAFVEKAQVNGKLYYRVRVGPEIDRARAERTAARLREQHKLDTLVQSYP